MRVFSFIRKHSSMMLLLCFVLSSMSCKNNDKSKSENDSAMNHSLPKENDSLTINIQFDTIGITGLNLKDKYLSNYHIQFRNPDPKDTIITKKIPFYHNNQIISYGGGWFKNGKPMLYQHQYLVSKVEKQLDFKFSEGELYDLNETLLSREIDSLRMDYIKLSKILKKISNQNEQLKKIDSLYELKHQKLIAFNNETATKLNEYHHITILQRIDPDNTKVSEFINSIDEDAIISSQLSEIGYGYIKNNISLFDYNDLRFKNEKAREIFNISLFRYLSAKSQIDKSQNIIAKRYLKHTEIYLQDSIYFKSRLEKMSKKTFKEKILSLRFAHEKKIQEVSKSVKARYYILDFWATWCAPCIDGIKRMDQMDMPDNVQVISISVDKDKDHDKWEKVARELGLEVSVRLSDTIPENKEFLKFIELESIPRYILIDKDFNLIDQAFYHPSEPQFLPKLKDVRNHERW